MSFLGEMTNADTHLLNNICYALLPCRGKWLNAGYLKELGIGPYLLQRQARSTLEFRYLELTPTTFPFANVRTV